MSEVIDDGDEWRIKIKDADKILAKKVATQKNPNVKVDVAIDLKTVDGKKTLDVSVANVYYPKSKYSREDIDSKFDEIVAKAKDPNCPLCQRFKTALSVEHRETFADKLMLPDAGLFTPKSVATPVLEAAGDLIENTIKSFELIVPGLDDVRKKVLDRK